MNEIKENLFKNNKNKNHMKSKILMFVSLLFILFFIGCQEEMVDQTPPETPKFTVKVSLHGAGGEISPNGNVQVLKGEDLKISVSKEVGIKATATADGVELPLFNSKNGYYFKVSSVSSNAVVDVNFEQTLKWQLAKHPWNLFSREYRKIIDNKYLYTSYAKGYTPVDTAGYISGTELKNLQFVFQEDTVKGYDINKNLVCNMKYTFNPEDYSITIGDGIKGKVLKLSDNEFIYSAKSTYYEVMPDGSVRANPEKDEMMTEKYIP